MIFCTKLKSRIDESSPQAKLFYRLCRNRTHTINEILNEIENQDGESSPQAKKKFHPFLIFRTVNPRRGGILIFRTGGCCKIYGVRFTPVGGVWKYPCQLYLFSLKIYILDAK